MPPIPARLGAWFCVLAACVAAACSSDSPSPGVMTPAPGGSAAAGSAGAAGTGVGGAAAGSSGASSTAGSNASGGMSVAGGGSGGSGGAGGGAGAGGMSLGGSGGSGGAAHVSRSGMKSAGCNKDPVGATDTMFTSHRIPIPACESCTVPNCPRTCVAPPWVPGGINAVKAGNGETYIDRDFTIQLPQQYDLSKPYPVFFGADGCGPAAPQKGAGYGIPGTNGAIRIGLQQIGQCFADGGIRCAPDIKNVGLCTNGPEIPYLLTVQKWVEDNFCVDLGQEFIGGGSSGAWEAILAGCAAADTFRGFYSVAGGLREHRWACNGPTAAFMIAATPDQANPVGPLAQLNVPEDTFGMAPARDEILKRNGCNGSEHAPYDAKYPYCVKYTGCPAAYPVVWCEFPNGAHNVPNYENINYQPAIAPFLLGLPPAP